MAGLRGFVADVFCAARGLRTAWCRERHLRWQTGAAALVIFVGRWSDLSAGEWALLALVSAVVLVTQVFNWVLEATLGLAVGEYNPLVRAAKDAAAGAVLIAASCAVIVFFLVMWPEIGSLVPRLAGGWRLQRMQLVVQILAVVFVLYISFRTYRSRD
ncbi:MAG: diacylglycerol kinase family protein [Bacillota bacterium]